MLCSYYIHGQIIIIIKKQEEIWGGDRYVYGLHASDGFTGIYLTPNLMSCVHWTHTFLKIPIIPQ